MCGIAGVITWNCCLPDAARLERMCARIEHRGPDAKGLYLTLGVALGHRRLKVIDLSDAANQPMPNETETVWAVFNGEIYNFKELRRELAERGHVLRSRGDTDVIVHGYEEWGEGVFARLDGMFAIAVWDNERRRVILARDRFGKKPLYYSLERGCLMFASDLKGLAAGLDSSPSLSRAALQAYLSHGYVPWQYCMFEGCAKVPPASYLIFEAGQVVAQQRYWQLRYEPKREVRSEAEILTQLEQHLLHAVEMRLVSDVPVGILLSGGIDSSLITAMAARVSGGRVGTFTVSFHDPALDEAPAARAVSEHCRVEHHELTVCEASLDKLPRVVWACGEPLGESSALATYAVFEALHPHATVALTGDGGDELFGGYSRLRDLFLAGLYRRFVPQSFGPGVRAFLGAIERRRSLPVLPRLARVGSRVSRYASQPLLDTYLGLRDNTWRRLLSTLGVEVETDSCSDVASILQSGPPERVLDRVLAADIAAWLTDDYLVKVDRASMAHSVEARSPMLDTAVAEFAASIPPEWHVRWARNKYLLRRLARRYLPKSIAARPKQGFNAPVGAWLRRTEARALALLEGRPALAEYLDLSCVRRMADEHRRGSEDHGKRLWMLLCLELWLRIFVEQSLGPNQPLRDVARVA